MPSPTSTDLLLLVAMRAEAHPILRQSGIDPSSQPQRLVPHLPALYWHWQVNDRRVALAINGIDEVHGCDRIGPIAAATTCMAALQSFAPRLVVNIGTCGGFACRGGALGDLHVPQRFLFHDQRVPLPGFRECAISAEDSAPADALRAELGALGGTCSSGGSLDAVDADRAALDAVQARCKDMEAAAIARVARDHGTPMIALKCVTDLVDHPEPVVDAFLRNLQRATQRLACATEALLRSAHLPCANARCAT